MQTLSEVSQPHMCRVGAPTLPWEPRELGVAICTYGI